MKHFLLIIFLFLVSGLMSQDKARDLELLTSQVMKDQKKQVSFKGPLKIYHKHISEQILNDCIYEHSCSEFSQGAFDRFGLFKGLMMTCDRLTRCNRTTLAETSPFRITREGKIKEEWDEYVRLEK